MSRRSADKEVAKSASEKFAVAALRRAETRREEKLKNTLYAYVAQISNERYTLPFYAVSDELAAQSFRSFVDTPDGAPLKGANLYRCAEYDVKSGVIQPLLVRKFVSY